MWNLQNYRKKKKQKTLSRRRNRTKTKPKRKCLQNVRWKIIPLLEPFLLARATDGWTGRQRVACTGRVGLIWKDLPRHFLFSRNDSIDTYFLCYKGTVVVVVVVVIFVVNLCCVCREEEGNPSDTEWNSPGNAIFHLEWSNHLIEPCLTSPLLEACSSRGRVTRKRDGLCLVRSWDSTDDRSPRSDLPEPFIYSRSSSGHSPPSIALALPPVPSIAIHKNGILFWTYGDLCFRLCFGIIVISSRPPSRRRRRFRSCRQGIYIF